MTLQYKTPGVYVEELNAFGSGIVANATAVPIFVGFTEKATMLNGEPLPTVEGYPGITMPVLVDSQLAYTQYFGGADTTGEITITGSTGNYAATITNEGQPYTPGYMFPSIQAYFANGGGDCYVVSLGSYDEINGYSFELEGFKLAIEYAEKSTLLVLTDLIRLGHLNYYSWCGQLMTYLGTSKKQFLIMDVIQATESSVYDKKDIEFFRENVSSEEVKYGTAYFPYLKSLMPYAYDDTRTFYDGLPLAAYGNGSYQYTASYPVASPVLEVTYSTLEESVTPEMVFEKGDDKNNKIEFAGSKVTVTVGTDGFTKAAFESAWKDQAGWKLKEIKGKINAPDSTEKAKVIEDSSWITSDKTITDKKPVILVKRAGQLPADKTASVSIKVGQPFTIAETDAKLEITTQASTGEDLLKEIADAQGFAEKDQYEFMANPGQSEVKNVDFPLTKARGGGNNGLYNLLFSFLQQFYINMPPAPAMAGIYSQVDNASGVWIPPANIAPSNITGPLVELTNKQQEDLNVDATSGKSVNAIRSFTGRGTLVWGARTLDGNSLDWRYLNVRRLFISLETDISIALQAFVFRPNVHNTWVDVKMMIDAYLYTLYQKGAFAGETPDQCYQVAIGVGETMTPEDVLEGLMKATIRVAPVRPAEFIELTFSQMMSE